MRTCLIIFLFCTVISQSKAQLPPVPDAITACDAAFTANTDPFNPMLVHFLDQSSGQITHWVWSFGDGSTLSIQNPEHTYLAGGTYFVCLTVSDSDSANLCHDVLCTAITIHEPGKCIADYHYLIDPNNLLKTHFNDQSSGNINRWHWDFGDGSFSSDRNPTHVFPSFGKFRVCLTAFNADSASVCNDVKCDSLAIMPSAECHAHFTIELDTLNPVPNTFNFKNTSSGDPNLYHWSIDDGASYNASNITHHFQSPGPHQVCLVIKKEEQGNIVCADSLCQSVFTAKYFDLGGHLFIGEYPINNPVATGDTGIAYLFRVDGPRLMPYDTSRFTYLGYYAFPKILNGFYIVRAALTRGSRHYANYFPTYFNQALTWNEANIMNLSDANDYMSDIHLAPLDSLPAGPGAIRGMVVKNSPQGLFENIPDAEVLLFGAQMKPLTFTVSDKSGQFAINNLPYGAYYLHVEYSGKYSRLTPVWLDPHSPVVDNLRLEVFNHDVTGISDFSKTTGLAGDLFPNPATSEVSLKIDLVNETTLKFEIKELTGFSVWAGSRECLAGSSLVTISLTSLKAGLYILVIATNDGSQVAVKKLLKF